MSRAKTSPEEQASKQIKMSKAHSIPIKKRQIKTTFKDESKSNTKNNQNLIYRVFFKNKEKKITIITSRFRMMLYYMFQCIT